MPFYFEQIYINVFQVNKNQVGQDILLPIPFTGNLQV